MNIKNIVIMTKHIVSLHTERVPLGGDIKLREGVECVVVTMVNGNCYIIPRYQTFVTEKSKAVELLSDMMDDIFNGSVYIVLPDSTIYQEVVKGE